VCVCVWSISQVRSCACDQIPCLPVRDALRVFALLISIFICSLACERVISSDKIYIVCRVYVHFWKPSTFICRSTGKEVLNKFLCTCMIIWGCSDTCVLWLLKYNRFQWRIQKLKIKGGSARERGGTPEIAKILTYFGTEHRRSPTNYVYDEWCLPPLYYKIGTFLFYSIIYK
jgi:hypothetical protein